MFRILLMVQLQSSEMIPVILYEQHQNIDLEDLNYLEFLPILKSSLIVNCLQSSQMIKAIPQNNIESSFF